MQTLDPTTPFPQATVLLHVAPHSLLAMFSLNYYFKFELGMMFSLPFLFPLQLGIHPHIALTCFLLDSPMANMLPNSRNSFQAPVVFDL